MGRGIIVVHTTLSLNLFPRPSSSLNGALRVFAIRPGLLDQSVEPICAEQIGEFALGECIGKVAIKVLAEPQRLLSGYLPDDTHG